MNICHKTEPIPVILNELLLDCANVKRYQALIKGCFPNSKSLASSN